MRQPLSSVHIYLNWTNSWQHFVNLGNYFQNILTKKSNVIAVVSRVTLILASRQISPSWPAISTWNGNSATFRTNFDAFDQDIIVDRWAREDGGCRGKQCMNQHLTIVGSHGYPVCRCAARLNWLFSPRGWGKILKNSHFRTSVEGECFYA